MHTKFPIIWAQVDPNGHLRHSAYYDLAAQVRVNVFTELGLSIHDLVKLGVGPILFREEAQFKRELVLNDQVKVDLKVKYMREDGYKWSFQHRYYKEDNTVAAIVTVEGAWLDLRARKVVVPPQIVQEVIDKLPKAEDFTLI